MVLIISALAGLAAVITIIALLATHRRPHQTTGDEATEALEKAATLNAQNIFDDKFREELRNRGRLHFEKIISENAMFLQQDLRLTTSQLNEFMKTEITNKLTEEFGQYEQSITDAKELAVSSIAKTSEMVEEQRRVLSEQVTQQLESEKTKLINRFEESMADIVNHYVVAAVGNQIDLTDQLEYIMGELEANKAAIAEDIRNGG